LATPFWQQNSGWSVIPAARRSSSAAAVSCPFTQSSTTSSGRKEISEGWATQGNGSSTVPRGLIMRIPSACSAASIRPRAMPSTSVPASISAAPTTPPMAPTP
jgi:hypothetical protein